jgi:hypothetical protein
VRTVSYGGGVNSTGLLVGLHERGIVPDAILFADTGNEFPETYDHVERVSAWSLEHLGLPITRIKRVYPRHDSLEDECFNLNTLPSKAFGYSGCSVKWKRQPMDRWIRHDPRALAAWARGERIERLIGIDAGEAHRGKIPDDEKFTYRFPLIEWGWARDECVQAIERAGLPVPRKSACFFCPATTKKEVIELHRSRRDLFDRAVAIEENAREHGQLTVVKGLGRHWSWSELVERGGTGPETPHTFCVECSDGSED